MSDMNLWSKFIRADYSGFPSSPTPLRISRRDAEPLFLPRSRIGLPNSNPPYLSTLPSQYIYNEDHSPIPTYLSIQRTPSTQAISASVSLGTRHGHDDEDHVSSSQPLFNSDTYGDGGMWEDDEAIQAAILAENKYDESGSYRFCDPVNWAIHCRAEN